MVSLSRTMNTNAESSAVFFSDSLEDNADSLPILNVFGSFKPLSTVPAFGWHLYFTLTLELAAIVHAVQHPDEKLKCQEYFILIYCHAAFWLITLIIDYVVRLKHYALRINGYLDFYKQTQVHHRLPFYVVSLWNAVILVLQTLMQHYYGDDFTEKCLHSGLLSPINSLLAIVTLEVCVICGININYILKVRKFNKAKAPPDVQREEWTACSNEESFAQGEVGVRQFGDKVLDLMEKQADMIRYLQDNNARLNKKLMALNARIVAQGLK